VADGEEAIVRAVAIGASVPASKTSNKNLAVQRIMFSGYEEGSPAARPFIPTSDGRVFRDSNGAAADVRIGQFPAQHNPP
jgi:hypothetical protein